MQIYRQTQSDENLTWINNKHSNFSLVTYFFIISDQCFSIRQQMNKIALLYDMPLNMKVTAMSSLCIVTTSGALT